MSVTQYSNINDLVDACKVARATARIEINRKTIPHGYIGRLLGRQPKHVYETMVYVVVSNGGKEEINGEFTLSRPTAKHEDPRKDEVYMTGVRTQVSNVKSKFFDSNGLQTEIKDNVSNLPLPLPNALEQGPQY